MSTLIVDAEKYVFNLLNTDLERKYVYHNLAHTQRVVDKTKVLIEKVKIIKTDAENLEIAAWFHDTGFIKGAVNHEEESVRIVTDFLKNHRITDKRIEAVSNLILSTKMNHQPKDDLEKIIADADCAHLASKSFFDYTSLLRKEWELTDFKNVSDSEWIADNIAFFAEQHRYNTEYALKNWTKKKEKNLSKLIKNQKDLKSDIKKFNQKQEALELKKEKGDVPERGVETMFRVALRNHITLSDIADTKANILLSVNAIIISMVLSILATRPNVTQGKFSKEDVANKKVNLLFFGNFHQMKLDDFEWGIKEMMKDREYLYGSLTKDLYFLGLVLNRKYSLLRHTYTVFMIGIIVSVLAFSIAFAVQGAV